MPIKLTAIAIVGTLLLANVPAQASNEKYGQWLEQEEAWFASLQDASGAIPMNRAHTRMVPYFTNLGLLALIENEAYSGVIKRWIEWYVGHLNQPDRWNVAGTIYDYEMRYGQLASTQDYDSSDSYAATFLSLVRAYYDATGDAEFVRSIESELKLIASAIYATMDPKDNLTDAKPNYPIKYLMDNAEVYMGLKDWAYLLDAVFANETEAQSTLAQAEATRDAVLAFWQGDHFSYARDGSGNLLPTDWRKWYPDATAQLFVIWTGVLSPDDPKAQSIWQRFNDEHPHWVRHGQPDAFPWTVVGYVATLIEDWERAAVYAEMIHNRYGIRGRAWPWYVAESGWHMRTLRALANRQQ